MVHDQSATGSTLFIEPMAIVKLNNEIRELEIQEQKEIEAVLSCLKQPDSSAYRQNCRWIWQLSSTAGFHFCQSALSHAVTTVQPPIFNDKGYINIKDGRHPLLDQKKVVPINVWLGRDFDLLIVTGPNTGGKTVSLKTVGLFTLMGQAGLHIPALEGSELAVFDDVFADIGDEQSIEQSLSTFSAHMTNIVTYPRVKQTAVLSVFSMSWEPVPIPPRALPLPLPCCHSLHNMKCRTMATTHYSELKGICPYHTGCGKCLLRV